MHPRLPGSWSSRALRVAMSEADWERFEARVREVLPLVEGQTLARAQGEVLSELLDVAEVVEHPAPTVFDWMEWERRKTLRLLRISAELDDAAGRPVPGASGPLAWMDWEWRKALRLLRERSAI